MRVIHSKLKENLSVFFEKYKFQVGNCEEDDNHTSQTQDILPQAPR